MTDFLADFYHEFLVPIYKLYNTHWIFKNVFLNKCVLYTVHYSTLTAGPELAENLYKLMG